MSKIVSAEALRKSLSEERTSPEKPRSPVKAIPSPGGAAVPSPAVGSPLAAGGAGTGTPQRTVIATPLKSPQAASALTPTRPSRKYKITLFFYFQYNRTCIRAVTREVKQDVWMHTFPDKGGK